LTWIVARVTIVVAFGFHFSFLFSFEFPIFGLSERSARALARDALEGGKSMETNPTCPCGKPLPPRHRKYCAEHSHLAGLLWKRLQRQACCGTRYWFDHWLKAEGSEAAARDAYNAYMRDYMRRYRAKQRRDYELTHAARMPKQDTCRSETRAGGFPQ
jgi:hypothetical protein